MKKKLLALTLGICMVAGLLAGCGNGNDPANTGSSGNGGGDDTVYRFNIDFPNPETACGFKALSDWEAKVEEESGGRLDINIYSGGALGALADCVTNCQAGVTDGFWSGVTLYPGVFPQTEVLGLPMIGITDHHDMNTVLNDMMENESWMQEEWSDFYVVGLHSSQPCGILCSKPVGDDPLASWKGLNLRLSNAYTSEWFSELGINPVSCGINDGYENISKSVIDGGLFFLDQVESSALYEVIDNIWLGDTVYALNMFCLNKDKYEALPDDLKAVIDDNCDYFVERIAYYFDDQEARMMEKFEEYDVGLVEVPEDELATMQTAAENSWQLWVETMNESGYDGQAILDCALEYVAEYAE